jgi:hypothetical protein
MNSYFFCSATAPHPLQVCRLTTVVKVRESSAITRSISSQSTITSLAGTSQLLYSVSRVNIFKCVSIEFLQSMSHKSSNQGQCDGGRFSMVVLHTTSKPVSRSANESRRMNLSRRRTSVCILTDSKKTVVIHEHPPSIMVGISKYQLLMPLRKECSSLHLFSHSAFRVLLQTRCGLTLV